jgi:hypothetical protein
MLRTGCLLAAQGDFVMALRWSGLPFHRPPATTLLGHYADRTLTGKSITASRTHTTAMSSTRVSEEIVDRHEANAELIRGFLDNPDVNQAFTSWARRESYRRIRDAEDAS